jgi:hypothetical protein
MAMTVKDEPLSADEATELGGLKTMLLQERIDGESQMLWLLTRGLLSASVRGGSRLNSALPSSPRA